MVEMSSGQTRCDQHSTRGVISEGTLMAKTSGSVVDYLRDADTVTIATKRPAGNVRETPIWAVVVDGAAYVRSARGPEGVWYENALREANATIVTPDGRLPVRVAPSANESNADTIDAAYNRKYGRYPQDVIAPLLAEPARQTTLKVSPAT
jgi:hypothetical protein